jgi:starch phosphorylase
MSGFNKDPVCGMLVRPGGEFKATHKGEQFDFCSDFCRRAFLADPDRYAEKAGGQVLAGTEVPRRIAYFSMEVGLVSEMPTYAGGLGVLAGDTLKSAADLKLPVVAVSLLSAKGYFDQRLDQWGNQLERPAVWEPSRFAHLLPASVEVVIEGRPVVIRAWQYDIVGVTGFSIPLLLLDTNVDGNSSPDRELTSWLYGGDDRYRLAQEIVLGSGGLRMLRALGYTSIERFHMNEGHAAFLVLELLRETNHRVPAQWDFQAVRDKCIFTTHTPVPAGHDQFSPELVQAVWGQPLPTDLVRMLAGSDRLNMTHLALNLSKYVNGVAKKHGEVSQEMFPGYSIDSITNGVHSQTWTGDSFSELYDRYIPGWRKDPSSLRYAIRIPKTEVWEAHIRSKDKLLDEVKQRSGLSLSRDVLTIGFARRATAYKRADLIFRDLGQLADITRTAGPIQLVFAGKAHPRDQGGKDLIRAIFRAAAQVRDQIPIIYLENYDIALSKLLTSGVDLWLNTPLRPLEASGTSGMKAAHNGVPSFSVLDGWWIEGHIEGVTGWSIGSLPGPSGQQGDVNAEDVQDLYHKLRTVIMPLFYEGRDGWIDIMRQTVAFNASFFNTHRMVQQYAASAYV